MKGTAYNPWEDHGDEVEVRQGVVSLPAFSRSIALRLIVVD